MLDRGSVRENSTKRSASTGTGSSVCDLQSITYEWAVACGDSLSVWLERTNILGRSALFEIIGWAYVVSTGRTVRWASQENPLPGAICVQ